MAGYYAALPYPYLVHGERMTCGMVCDVMTSPRLRGKGVFTKLGAYSLGELEKDGVDFVTGYPRRAAVIPGHIKVGWHIAFRMPMYLLPLRLDSLLRTRKVGFLSGLANPVVAAVRGLTSLVLPVAEGFEVKTLSPAAYFAEEDHASYQERWRSGKSVVLLKSQEFLEWRLGVSEVDYRVVTVHRKGELLGMSIVRACEPEGVPSLAILDLTCVAEETNVLRAMRREWIRLAAEWNLETMLVAMSEFHAHRIGLRRLGFLRTPVVFEFILKRLSRQAQERLPSGPEDWHLMWIDSDDL